MSPDAIEAEIAQCDARSRQATQAGAQAFARLLKLAEERDSGQIARIARFLAATYNSQAFQLDLFDPPDVPRPAGFDLGRNRLRISKAKQPRPHQKC